MATVYDFLNADSSEVEEQRVIRVAGTTGDVLTLQANGTVSPAPGGGSSQTLEATGTIDAAALKTLSSQAVEVIPAPGPSKVLQPIFIVILSHIVSPFYSQADGQSDLHMRIDRFQAEGDAPVTFGVLVVLASDCDGAINSNGEVLPSFDLSLTGIGTLSGLANQPLICSANADSPGGLVTATTINDPGSGYQAGDSLSDPFDNSQEVTVDTVDGGGAVTGYTLAHGYCATQGTVVTYGGGSGDGAFALNITAADTPSGSLDYRILYSVLDFA